MLFTGLVISDRFLHQRGFQRLSIDQAHAVRRSRLLFNHKIQCRQECPRIAVAIRNQLLPRIGQQTGIPLPQPDRRVRQRPVQNMPQGLIRKRLEHND